MRARSCSLPGTTTTSSSRNRRTRTAPALPHVHSGVLSRQRGPTAPGGSFPMPRRRRRQSDDPHDYAMIAALQRRDVADTDSGDLLLVATRAPIATTPTRCAAVWHVSLPQRYDARLACGDAGGCLTTLSPRVVCAGHRAARRSQYRRSTHSGLGRGLGTQPSTWTNVRNRPSGRRPPDRHGVRWKHCRESRHDQLLKVLPSGASDETRRHRAIRLCGTIWPALAQSAPIPGRLPTPQS